MVLFLFLECDGSVMATVKMMKNEERTDRVLQTKRGKPDFGDQRLTLFVLQGSAPHSNSGYYYSG